MVFGSIVKQIKHKKRIFSDINVINEIGNYIDGINTSVHTMDDTHLLDIYMGIAGNTKVVYLIDQYSDLMTRSRSMDEYIDTGGLVNIAFHRIARDLSEKDSIEMVEYICYKNNTLQKTCVLAYSDEARYGMECLAKIYPKEDKLKFYPSLEEAGFLESLIFRSTGYGIGNFISYAMDGVDTETALTILNTSNIWKAVKKDQDLRNGFLQRGEERLFPALNY